MGRSGLRPPWRRICTPPASTTSCSFLPSTSRLEHVALGVPDGPVERAEAAARGADVGVVDVAIDDVRDHAVGVLPLSHRVRGSADVEEGRLSARRIASSPERRSPAAARRAGCRGRARAAAASRLVEEAHALPAGAGCAPLVEEELEPAALFVAEVEADRLGQVRVRASASIARVAWRALGDGAALGEPLSERVARAHAPLLARDGAGPPAPRRKDERQAGPLEPCLPEVENVRVTSFDGERRIADDQRGRAFVEGRVAPAPWLRADVARFAPSDAREQEPREKGARARRRIERDRLTLVERALGDEDDASEPARARRWQRRARSGARRGWRPRRPEGARARPRLRPACAPTSAGTRARPRSDRRRARAQRIEDAAARSSRRRPREWRALRVAFARDVMAHAASYDHLEVLAGLAVAHFHATLRAAPRAASCSTTP